MNSVVESRVLWLPADPNYYSNQMRVHGFGIHELMPPCLIHRPSGTDDFLLMQFHDPVQIGANGKLVDFPAQTFVIWQPHDLHHYGHPHNTWDHSWIHCSGKQVAYCLRSLDIEFGQPVVVHDATLIDKYLQSISEELCHYAKPDTVILENLLTIWMRELSRARSLETHDQQIPQHIQATRRYIERRASEHICIRDLAAVAELSVSHFCAEFKRYFGVTPISYAIAQRLNKSATLLHDPNRSVAQVANTVGFDDQFYFSRKFKQHFGDSPTHYRNKYCLVRKKNRSD